MRRIPTEAQGDSECPQQNFLVHGGSFQPQEMRPRRASVTAKVTPDEAKEIKMQNPFVAFSRGVQGRLPLQDLAEELQVAVWF